MKQAITEGRIAYNAPVGFICVLDGVERRLEKKYSSMAVLDPISLLYIVHGFDGLLTLFMQYVIRYSCDY